MCGGRAVLSSVHTSDLCCLAALYGEQAAATRISSRERKVLCDIIVGCGRGVVKNALLSSPRGALWIASAIARQGARE